MDKLYPLPTTKTTKTTTRKPSPSTPETQRAKSPGSDRSESSSAVRTLPSTPELRSSLSRASRASAPPIPLIPSLRSTFPNDLVLKDAHHPLESMSSIKDDILVPQYQLPYDDVSRLSSASSSFVGGLRDEDIPKEPPPRSSRRPSLGQKAVARLPVCGLHYLFIVQASLLPL